LGELRLTPGGRLQWIELEPTAAERKPDPWGKLFAADWREGLFRLGAQKLDPGLSLTVRFWTRFAEQFLMALCHWPESMPAEQLAPPDEAEWASWVLTAPPMQGGEYLSPETLGNLWSGLAGWCGEQVAAGGGLGAFLAAQAPRWHQVGRVFFHLAENKADPERPFAFMATYVSGLGAAGQARHLPLRQALQQYAGANDRPALIKLLSPVQAAADQLEWVRQLIDSNAIYQPLAWTPERAYQFLLAVPILEECGLMVRLPDWWRRRPRPRVAVTIGETKPARLGLKTLLDFDVQVALGEESLTPEEIAALLAQGDGLVLLKGQWVEVDREKLQAAIRHWDGLRREAREGGLSFIEGMRLLAGASENLKVDDAIEASRPWAQVDAGSALREILAGLRAPETSTEDEAAGLLKAELRPYQRRGVAWLRLISGLGLGACLADDMGLGKTIQVLALLLGPRREEEPARGPSLLVVPASLLGNWRAEAGRFAPSLRLVFLHPSEIDRSRLEAIERDPVGELAQADLVLTTYAMLTRQEWLGQVNWRLIILDEAQAIKNPGTAQTKAVKKLPAQARLALTGTPVENRLGDLWSLFDFLNPGLLGSAAVFKKYIQALSARETDPYSPLRRLVSPYILRRMKTDRAIIADLPDKVEATRFCALTRAQVRLYEQVVHSLKEALAGAEGVRRRGLVLQSLLRLKQVCNHPSQLTGDGDFAADASGKFQRLTELGEEMAQRQDRVLVFTQFREMIEPLADHLRAIFGRPGLALHGGTSVGRRKEIVAAFQDENGPPFLILSLKAGGTGLNLTAANHVIHFDRWWNPAVEDQATDRAFRIGQRRNVLVHKFVTRGSVEERIDQMIAEKRQMAREVLTGEGEMDLTSLSDDELLDLVRLDISRAVA
jgi:non-specific serine/threonine protein kinase